MNILNRTFFKHALLLSIMFLLCAFSCKKDNNTIDEPDPANSINAYDLAGTYVFNIDNYIELLSMEIYSNGISYYIAEYSKSSNSFKGWYYGKAEFDVNSNTIYYLPPIVYYPERLVNSVKDQDIKERPLLNSQLIVSQLSENSITLKSPSGSQYVGTRNNEYTKSESPNVERESVDLGLSVKWARCNIGAKKAEEFGLYTGWGDPNGTNYSTKNSDYPYTRSIVGTRNDAATANWGSPWRMPTFVEMQELFIGCVKEEITFMGITGCKYVGPSGKAIFLPRCGHREGNSVVGVGNDCFYWSGEQYLYSDDFAWGHFSGSSGGWYSKKYYGCSVRAVR